MNRKNIIIQLRAAKAAHIQWRAYAQAIVGGFSVNQQKLPVIHTNCKFGQWYYSKGQMLSGLKSYAGIDAPHAELHQIYMDIYKLLFSEVKVGIFQSKKKQRLKNKALAEEKFHELLHVSETLLEAINKLEQEVRALDDDEIEALY